MKFENVREGRKELNKKIKKAKSWAKSFFSTVWFDDGKNIFNYSLCYYCFHIPHWLSFYFMYFPMKRKTDKFAGRSLSYYDWNYMEKEEYRDWKFQFFMHSEAMERNLKISTSFFLQDRKKSPFTVINFSSKKFFVQHSFFRYFFFFLFAFWRPIKKERKNVINHYNVKSSTTKNDFLSIRHQRD